MTSVAWVAWVEVIIFIEITNLCAPKRNSNFFFIRKGISGIGRSVTKSCVNGLCTQRVCSNGLCVGGGGSGIYRGSGMYEGSGMYGGGGIYEGNELGGLGGLYGGLGRNLLSGSSFVSNPLLSTNGKL